MSAQQSTEDDVPRELIAELQQAADRAAKGTRDPEAMRRAVESLNALREQIRQRQGLLDIAVPSIRDLRDQ